MDIVCCHFCLTLGKCVLCYLKGEECIIFDWMLLLSDVPDLLESTVSFLSLGDGLWLRQKSLSLTLALSCSKILFMPQLKKETFYNPADETVRRGT